LFFVLRTSQNQPYEIEHPLGGGDICTVFSVAPSMLKDLTEGSWQDQGFPETQPFRQNHIRISFATSLKHSLLLRTGSNIPRENILGFEEAVLEFLKSLFGGKNFPDPGKKGSNKKTTREAHKDLVERTILFLNKNFCRNFTITGLANEVFSSPFHLCRVFRDEAGMTLHSYISGLRLRTALKALREKNISLTELALDLGYSSHSHFSSSFRRAFSLSPKEYRNH
jgi:AraC-like DNA-binding protein